MIENVNRRDVMQIAAVFGAMSALAPLKRALAQSPLSTTPPQILGPFYPVGKTPDTTGDLTHLPGKTAKAEGQVLYVTGRVLTLKGEPVRGAKLDIWQANAKGKYTHPADATTMPIDPNFEGFCELKTDEEGRYQLKTIKPGSYQVSPTYWRPPHIHFTMTGKVDMVTTQLYFENEPLNDKDPFLQSIPKKGQALLIGKLLPPTPKFEPDSKLVVFDIVTLKG
jgi:protocatechuate 3,4-dioxygenase beta subunit